MKTALPFWEMPTIENLRGTMLTKSQVLKLQENDRDPEGVIERAAITALIDTALELMAANEKQWAWQSTAGDLLKLFEHAVSALVSSSPSGIHLEPEKRDAARFGTWIDGARKTCAKTRLFLREGTLKDFVDANDDGEDWMKSFRGTARAVAGCTCAEIMAKDVTRHFKGCPEREKYPTHEAEKHALSAASTTAAIYKDALIKIIDLIGPEAFSSTSDAVLRTAKEALSPSSFAEDDPRVQTPDFVPGSSAPNPMDLDAVADNHKQHMDHLLEKSSVPAIHYLAAAVKHLLAGYATLGILSDEHHGRLNMIENMAENLNLIQRIKKLEVESRTFQPWNVGESPLGIVQRIETLEDRMRTVLESRIANRVNAVEKAVILHEQRVESLEKHPAMYNGPISELVNILIRARTPVEQKEVLESFQRQLLQSRARTEAPTAPEPAAVDVKRDAIPVKRIIPQGHPKIVCLCGSTRFASVFRHANLEETLKGNIVLTVGSMTHSDSDIKACIYCGQVDTATPKLCTETVVGHEWHPLDSKHHIGTKRKLDALHKQKIEIADEVFVLNAKACVYCKKLYAGIVDGCPEAPPRPGSRTPFHGEHRWEPYIGDSTRSEIAHAMKLGKPIRFLNRQLVDEAYYASIGLPRPRGLPLYLEPADTITYRAGPGYDGSFNTEAAVAIVKNYTDLYLAVWNKKLQVWTMPGGKVEPNENVYDAAVRELQEETGLVTESSDIERVYSAPGSVDPHVTVSAFIVRNYNGVLKAEAGSAIEWLSKERFIDQPHVGDYYKRLFAAMKEKR